MAKSHCSYSTLTVALTAVVVSSVVAAAGLTIAQSGSSTETWSCDMNAGGEKGQGPTTCGGQGRPSWPDCVKFMCNATSSGSSGGGSCPGSPPTTTSWCDMSTGTPTWKESGGGGYTGGGSTGGSGSCPGSPPSSTSWCDMSTGTPTWKESGGSGYTGGGMGSCQSPYPMGGPYSCDAGVFKCYGANIPDPSQTGMYTCTPSGWMKGGGTSGDGSMMPATCTACITAGGTQLSCPTCPGYTGGGSTSYGGSTSGGGSGMNRHNCWQPAMVNGVQKKVFCRDYDAHCSETREGAEIPAGNIQFNGGPSSCDDWGSQTGGGYGGGYTSGGGGYGGGYTSGGGGSGGSGSVEWCFYSATRNGSDLGYSIACPRGSIIDCHRETRAGSSVDSVGLVLGKVVDGQCWWEGGGSGGSYGTSGGYGGTGGGSSMRRCIYHNATWQPNNQLNKTGPVKGDVHCREDYVGCDVVSSEAGTSKTLPVDTTKGYGIPDPRRDVSLGAPFCCEEGWSKKCEGSSMNCRDEKAYWQCLGGRNVPTNTALSRSCEEKHCWFRDGDSGGGNKPPEGCKGTPPTSEEYGTWECVNDGGKWDWKFKKLTRRPPEEDLEKFCAKFPENEKCKKPEPGTLEEKLAALEKTIGALDEQVENLKLELADAKDVVTEKNDEIRALKKGKAPKAEVNAAKKELKALKKAVSAIVSKGKKLARELKFREQEYNRLSRQLPYFPPPMAQ